MTTSPPALGAVSAWAPVLGQAQPPALDMSTLLRDERQAWQQLGLNWKVKLDDADPCAAAANAQLACFRSQDGLPLIKALERPVILTLVDEHGTPVYALLTALSAYSATLHTGQRLQTISLAELNKHWHGHWSTLWKMPPQYDGKLTRGSDGVVVDWLASRLAQWAGEAPPAPPIRFNSSLQSKVRAFQRAQGLKADGVAGSTTFMQINRVSGVDEPRLTIEN
jgi:general secretion pathway protein A